MHWSTNEYLVLVTGALFLAIVVASASPSVSLTRASYVMFGLGATVFTGASFALAWVSTVRYPPVMWVLPVVPVVVIGVLVRDAVATRRALTDQPERATAVVGPDERNALAAPIDSRAERTTFGGGGEGNATGLSEYQHA